MLADPIYDSTLLDERFDEICGIGEEEGTAVTEAPTEVDLLWEGKCLTVADDFVSGIAGRALLLLFIAMVALGGSIFGPVLLRPSPRAGVPEEELAEEPVAVAKASQQEAPAEEVE